MKMDKLQDRFQELMSAITFAEAGEHEKAREILKERKTVLLAVSEKMFDGNALKFVLQISKRIEACIDMLYLAKSGADNPELEEFKSKAEKEGIRCRVMKKDGCMKKAILDYTEKKSEILFVVVGSTPELEVECKAGEKSLSNAWRRLKCPLVVVSKDESPLTA